LPEIRFCRNIPDVKTAKFYSRDHASGNSCQLQKNTPASHFAPSSFRRQKLHFGKIIKKFGIKSEAKKK